MWDVRVTEASGLRVLYPLVRLNLFDEVIGVSQFIIRDRPVWALPSAQMSIHVEQDRAINHSCYSVHYPVR